MNSLYAARKTLSAIPKFASSVLALSLSVSSSFAVDTTWSGTVTLNSAFEVKTGDVLYLVPNTNPVEDLDLTIGSEPSATGELTVSGGLIRLEGVGSKGIFLGDGGTGILNVTSGTISYGGSGGTNRLWVGAGAGGVATLNQSGGLIDLGSPASFYIGYNGSTGVYKMSGDAEHLSGVTITIGRGVGGNGRLEVTDNAKFSALQGDNGLRLGYDGATGVIHQSGNSLVEFRNPAAFLVGQNAGSLGTYELVSGTLVVDIGRGAETGPRFGVSSGTG
jgi:hypothetical protein